MIRFQRTIKNRISFEGVGLHSGRRVTMTIMPATPDAGVVFIRKDLGGVRIEAAAANTATTSYATTLRKNGASVQTVEHLLGALAGLGITNALVEIDGDEVPILDGSAGPFIRMIVDAGIKVQDKVQPMLKVTNPMVVREGDKQLAIWPSDSMSISYFLDFDHPLMREQSFSYRSSEEAFIREVADARTFGFLSEVEALQANGLAKGGSLENAVVLGPDSVMNKEGLRYKDEFVRHKVLDIIGDLALLRMPVIGHIIAHKSGHSLNAVMVNRLQTSTRNWVLMGDPAATAPQRTARAYRELVAI